MFIIGIPILGREHLFIEHKDGSPVDGFPLWIYGDVIDRLVQERCNSIANALELRLSCTNIPYTGTEIILQMHPANERRH